MSRTDLRQVVQDLVQVVADGRLGVLHIASGDALDDRRMLGDELGELHVAETEKPDAVLMLSAIFQA
jgi:hypothetical protein